MISPKTITVSISTKALNRIVASSDLHRHIKQRATESISTRVYAL